jgi:hypothetical protein
VAAPQALQWLALAVWVYPLQSLGLPLIMLAAVVVECMRLAEPLALVGRAVAEQDHQMQPMAPLAL